MTKLEVGVVDTSLAFCLAPDSDHFLIGTAHGAALCKVFLIFVKLLSVDFFRRQFKF